MGKPARNAWLTLHVAASVSWAGSVATFLVLAIVGLSSSEPATVQAVYRVLPIVAWWVIVPFSFASLATGIVESLTTSWGLFQHYWVVAKLLLNVGATALLLVHTQPIDLVAAEAARTTLTPESLAGVRLQIVVDAAAALVALIVATALSVFKPAGATSAPAPRWVYASSTVIGLCVLLIVAAHLSGHGMPHH